jgi:hypothetical protein
MRAVNRHQTAAYIVKDMERVSPYLFEGLYGSFLRTYMDSDKSKWTADLAAYLTHMNGEWKDLSTEIATLLWEAFEKRISC